MGETTKPMASANHRMGHNNCPVLERTDGGHRAGRCWNSLRGGICARHGDVSKYLDIYQETGKLTDEGELGTKRKPNLTAYPVDNRTL